MVYRVKPKLRKETSETTRTFQMRLEGKHPELADMGVRYGTAKRTVYARSARTGKPFTDLKQSTCAHFGIPSRIFSSIQRDLAGVVSGAQEKAKFDIGQVKDKLNKITKDIPKLELKLINPKLGGKRRKAAKSTLIRRLESRKRLSSKLVGLEGRSVNPYPSLCFGGRKLFNAQHYLRANRIGSHSEWRDMWRATRSDQFMVVGSNDERGGNNTCRATVNEDDTISLRLFLGEDHGYVEFSNLKLPHGHAEWLEALAAADVEFRISQVWQKETAAKVTVMEAELDVSMTEKARAAALKDLRATRLKERKAQLKHGHGIAYRFLHDELGWRLIVTVSKTVPLLRPDFSHGAIGVDLNAQHVSRTRIRPDGSFGDGWDIPLVSMGRTSGQRLARLHDVAARLVREARLRCVPIVIEQLDFSAKKMRLREIGAKAAARGLSSFAYSKFAAVLKSHARLHGVCVVEVSPAYTSVIGAALHAVPNGLTVHAAAAMSIARRAMAVEETLPERMRVWFSGRSPLSIERPSCLLSKAAVEPRWMGWVKLSKAVLEARILVETKQKTGKVLSEFS